MILALVAAMAAATPAADTVVGRWKTETKNAVVDIARCGAQLCGTLVSSDAIRANPAFPDAKNPNPALRAKPLKGSRMLSGFTRQGTEWVGGQIYKADEGKTYSGKITPVDANTLKLRGCIFVPLCKTQTWTRAQ